MSRQHLKSARGKHTLTQSETKHPVPFPVHSTHPILGAMCFIIILKCRH